MIKTKTPAKFLLCAFVAMASLFMGHHIRSAATADDHAPAGLDNPHIDMPGFLRMASEAAAYRESHRVSEDDFLHMSQVPGTIILDARSREKFDLMHVRGAINLSFPDIDIASLQRTLPDKDARILIYCNNNFGGNQSAFPGKQFSASLNLSTYVTLYTYGYRNVYELGPFVNVRTTRLPLVPRDAVTSR